MFHTGPLLVACGELVWLRGGGGTSTAWQGVHCLLSKDGSHTWIMFSKKKLSQWLCATPFYQPQAKDGARTGKRRAVAQIPLLYWATAALATPRQTLVPETGLDAH